MQKKIVNILLVVALLLGTFSSMALAADESNGSGSGVSKEDDKSHPLGDRQRDLKSQALQNTLNGSGNVSSNGKVAEVAHGQFVELAREGEDSIWTVLGEFADMNHNEIAEPDRDFDNTTNWMANFNRGYYMDTLFNEDGVSMRNMYIEMSSGRYAVNGDVTNWVEVSGNAASYDDDAGALALWSFLQESIDGWYDAKVADGWTAADFDAYLSGFDVWDRYDYDFDGNFNEPDGYIDHFQIVHAGEGEEAGGGVLGGQAIWSHRWYAAFNLIGAVGSPYVLDGGLQVGGTDYWIGDYTIEPENGGLGVFAHEFAHDLGLPDLYDTSGGENATGFWTLMSSGSWLGTGKDSIGTKPGHMGGWEKFQLGWLNYEVAFANTRSTHKLGPASANTKKAQGVFVVLPQKEVTENIGPAYAGSQYFYSGSGNNLDNWMYKEFTLGAGSSLTAQVNYEIEPDWDYAYLVVSTDGGATWANIATDHSTNANPNGQNFGNGIMGFSGGWTTLTADLSAYTGNVLIGFRYWTDVAAVELGFKVDEISITGHATEGAEAANGWTFDGFRRTVGIESGYYNHYYLAEFRNYRGYDKVLKTGPYNFGFTDDAALGNWVEHFPYQDGMLVSYWDTSQSNNNTNQHPGAGLVLPIDAHPDVMYDYFGNVWRSRIQTYDATFGLDATDAITLHSLSQASNHPSLARARKFNDNLQYYNPDSPLSGVINPHTGTQIIVKSISARNNFMQILVK
ncbi:MAG: immune inhibitor A [Chloroflexota bacterium]